MRLKYEIERKEEEVEANEGRGSWSVEEVRGIIENDGTNRVKFSLFLLVM